MADTTLFAGSSRTLVPLVGAAAVPGPEKPMHDELFSRLIERKNTTRHRVFGEVPSPSGTVDIVVLRLQSNTDWDHVSAAGMLVNKLRRDELISLANMSRQRSYRPSTVARMFGDHLAIERLLDLSVLTWRDQLITRAPIPADFISGVASFEVKAYDYRRGVVQAACRKSIATQSWLVLPCAASASRLRSNTAGLIERVGIGLCTPMLKVMRRPDRLPRPNRILLTQLLRSIAQGARHVTA